MTPGFCMMALFGLLQGRFHFCDDILEQAACERVCDLALHHAAQHELLLKLSLLLVVHFQPLSPCAERWTAIGLQIHPAGPPAF
jgi:hypothetical protein